MVPLQALVRAMCARSLLVTCKATSVLLYMPSSVVSPIYDKFSTMFKQVLSYVKWGNAQVLVLCDKVQNLVYECHNGTRIYHCQPPFAI